MAKQVSTYVYIFSNILYGLVALSILAMVKYKFRILQGSRMIEKQC
jgi:hypothetical protein